jgi:GATA-binding protein
MMATMANNDRETTQPTCQNCATSTTPLWRRDEMGSVLCNACGLFLKLHGRPRPISLKTDVIKSRNRVKTMRPDLAKQKKVSLPLDSVSDIRRTRLPFPHVIFQRDANLSQQAQNLPPGTDANGTDMTGANMAAALGGRRPSAKSTNGHLDDTQSPISRTGTPNMYSNTHGLQMYPSMDDPQFQAQGLGSFGVAATADGRVPSPMNGEHPQTQESLLQENASLKTRVSELEVIQELYRGRLQQLEQDEANAHENKNQLHSQLEAAQQTETQLRNELEESHHRENMLKRRLDELELELNQAKDSVDVQDNERHAKKPRTDSPNDMETDNGAEEALQALKTEESDPTPQPAT